MKILFIAPRFHTNQIEIVKGLKSKGHTVFYLVAYKGWAESYETIQPIVAPIKKRIENKRLKILKSKGSVAAENWLIRNYISSYGFMVKFLKRYQPDVLIFRERSRQTRHIYLLAKLLGFKTCVLYNQEPLNCGIKQNFFKKIFFNFTTPKVRYTPVKYVKNNVTNTNKRTYFLPFVQTTPGVSREVNEQIKILCVGKYRDYKDHKTLINALYKLKDKDQFEVLIVGQCVSKEEVDYFNELKHLIVQKKLENHISLKMNLDYKKMREFYLNHDIFVLPSKKEMASIAVLEAMAHGCAVISSDNNGTASYVIEANSGYTFKNGNDQDLADKISELINNPSLIKNMSLNAVKFINDYCSFDYFYRVFREMLEKEFNLNIKED